MVKGMGGAMDLVSSDNKVCSSTTIVLQYMSVEQSELHVYCPAYIVLFIYWYGSIYCIVSLLLFLLLVYILSHTTTTTNTPPASTATGCSNNDPYLQDWCTENPLFLYPSTDWQRCSKHDHH